MCQGGKPDTGKFHSSYIGMNLCGSAYENGCVVDGMCAAYCYDVPILFQNVHTDHQNKQRYNHFAVIN